MPRRGYQLEFHQDGLDLLVSTRTVANNSPYMVLVRHEVNDKADEILLQFDVVQDRDLFVRSFQYIQIEWRIPGRKKGTTKFRVEPWELPLTEADLGKLRQAGMGQVLVHNSYAEAHDTLF